MYTFFCRVAFGACAFLKQSLDESQDTSWTGHQCITGDMGNSETHRTKNHAHTHSYLSPGS